MPHLPETLIDNVFKASPFGMAICKMIRNNRNDFVDYMHLDVNDAVEVNTGFKPDQLLSKTASELLDKESLAILVERYGTVVSTGKATKYQQYFALYERHLDVTAYHLSEDYFGIHFFDITKQKNAENTLFESEKKHRTILEHALNGFWIVNTNGALTEVNQAYCQMSGYTKEELLGKTISDVEVVEMSNETTSRIQKVIKEGSNQFESIHRRKDGSTFNVEIKIQYQNYNEERFIVFIEDITERKEVEKDLLKNQYYLKKAQEIGRIGTWELDILKDQLFWTEQNYKIFGIAPGTPLNYRLFLRSVHPDDKEHVDNAWTTAANGGPYDVEHRIVVNGEVKWVREKADITFDKKGNAIRAVGFTQEITEHKNIQAKLQQSLERETTLADIVRNTPVAFAFGYPDGTLDNCNEAFTHLTGYSEKELKEIKWNSVLTPEKWIAFETEELSKLTPLNNSVRYEKEYIRKDGLVIPIELTVTGKFDQDRIIHYIGFISDITERKSAEKELLIREKNLSALLQNPAGYLIYRTHLELTTGQIEVLQVSPSYVDILGISEAEKNEFHTWFSRVHPDDVPKIMKASEEGMRPPFKLDIEIRYNHPVKGVVWLEIRATGVPFEDNPNLIEYANGIILDITERKKAEEELRIITRRLKISTESANIGIWDLDLKNNILTWDKRMFELYGTKPEDFEGAYEAWQRGVHPDDVERSDEEVKKAIAGEKGFHTQFRVVWPDGQIRHIEAHAIIQRDSNGLPQSMTGVNWDITERKQILKTLQERNNYIESVMDNMPIGFAVNTIDDGDVKYMNSLFEDIYGWSRDVLTNTSIFFDKVFPDPLYREKMKSRIVAGMQSGDPERMKWNDLKIVTSKGETRYVYALNIPLISQNLMISTVQDTTKRKLAEENLIKAKERAEESDQLKSAFLANMSHEIRTPMNGILGFTDLLNNQYLSGEQRNKFIGIIRKSGNRMLNTVNDIIDISKIDAGQVEVTKDVVNICEEINSQFEFFNAEASRKGLTLKLINEIPRKDNIIITDKVKLNSIVSNLIKNAIKYTDEGSVELHCSKCDSNFVCEVTDTGIGIPHKRIESIFNRFEQADLYDSSARQGSGLGLAITKSYVKMLEGDVSVVSTPGKGSTFRVTLPWVEPTGETIQQDMEPIVEEVQEHKLRILIAEDDDTSYEHMEIILTPIAANISRVSDGKEAITFVKKNPDTDLVLMDINMPVLDGHEATIQIREFNKEIRIIAQTAYALQGDKEKALEAGCNAYISKPINREELLALIK